MLVYDEEGLAAARSWLARTGLADEPRFVDLVRAALYAVPRVKDKGEFARPEARVLDSLRATLFEQIPARGDDAASPIQEAMFQIEGELGSSCLVSLVTKLRSSRSGDRDIRTSRACCAS